jgi:hypothetical protein
MALYNPDCLGEYDFDNIAHYARKRFIEGQSTIELLQQAKSTREKEEIALVATMDLDDKTVKDIKLTCQYAEKCKVTTCRKLIRQLIEDNLVM